MIGQAGKITINVTLGYANLGCEHVPKCPDTEDPYSCRCGEAKRRTEPGRVEVRRCCAIGGKDGIYDLDDEMHPARMQGHSAAHWRLSHKLRTAGFKR